MASLANHLNLWFFRLIPNSAAVAPTAQPFQPRISTLRGGTSRHPRTGGFETTGEIR